MSDSPELLAKMPPEARTALETARAASRRFAAGTDTTGFSTAVNETARAFDRAGIPRSHQIQGAFPRAESFDEGQRAVLLWSALEDLGVGGMFGVPRYPDTRRRWLGVEAGLLETLVVAGEPLWRALQLANRTPAAIAILDALSFDVALRVIAELSTTGRAYGIVVEDERLRMFRELRDEGRAWAIATAGAFPRAKIGAGGRLGLWIFVALARAGVPVERAWEDLFPADDGLGQQAFLECARALPDDRRAEALKPHLASWPWAVDVVAAFPTAAMVAALLAGVPAHGPRWLHWAEELRRLGVPAITEAVDAIVATTPEPLPPIELFYARLVRPTRVAELTPLEREQLRIGARGYDAQDLDAAARLDRTDPESETAVGDTLELRTICDAKGKALYDAFSYFVDAGVIFRAGTTEEVGWIGQGGGVVLKEPNEPLREALQRAVGPQARPAKKRRARRKPPPR